MALGSQLRPLPKQPGRGGGRPNAPGKQRPITSISMSGYGTLFSTVGAVGIAVARFGSGTTLPALVMALYPGSSIGPVLATTCAFSTSTMGQPWFSATGVGSTPRAQCAISQRTAWAGREAGHIPPPGCDLNACVRACTRGTLCKWAVLGGWWRRRPRSLVLLIASRASTILTKPQTFGADCCRPR